MLFGTTAVGAVAGVGGELLAAGGFEDQQLLDLGLEALLD